MRTPHRGSVLALLAASCSTIGDRPTPPVVTYGGSRESSAWVDTGGGLVAVDRGASWHGTTVYLSLLSDLVAVDDATGKTRWSRSVGAFWNEFTFCEVARPDGQRAWAVELRPGPAATQATDRRQFHDLATGALLPQPDVAVGADVPIPAQWHGAQSLLSTPLRLLVGSDDVWQTQVVARMFGGAKAAPDLGPIDWTKHVVLVVASGDSWNSDGRSARAFDQGGTLLVRLDEHTYQTSGPDGGGHRVQPWGIFVLRRREPFGRIVVQRNVQNLIGGPEIWEESCRFDGPGEPMAMGKGSR